jgi:SAM-dependent methyltransferase
VAALYMLYHFADSLLPMREAARVLRPGGTFVCCAPSRFNYPELAAHMPPEPLETFDAENGPEQVAAIFADVRVEPWDMHLFRLPDAEAVWMHLVARMIEPSVAEAVARKVRTPLWVRARGAVIWARKRT